VPGHYPAMRHARRAVSHPIVVTLLEVLDVVVAASKSQTCGVLRHGMLLEPLAECGGSAEADSATG